MTLTKLILIYLVAINLITFIVYGIDKFKAKKNWWRIPEATLLLLAAIGGSIGAWLGMKVWHHKTMHKKFKYGVPAIILLQLVAVFALTNTSCSNKTSISEEKKEPQMTGAYTQGKKLSKEERELFENTYKGEKDLTPLSVSTQVVAGINYKYICQDKEGKKYKVVIYKKLPAYGGEAEVTSVEPLP